jgi:error-prone DNA polymerase
MATFRHIGTIHTFQDKFIAGLIENGYDRDFAERCFNQIKGFGDYGFPESHAASFALLVYISAWIKHFHPEVFCAAILNSQPMGFYQPAQLVRDAREHGVEIRPPDVNLSDWDCTLELAGGVAHRCAVRLGLRLIGGLAEAQAKAIVGARGQGYADVRSLWIRSAAPVATLERLAAADAFRSLGLDRRAALWAVKGLDGGSLRPILTGTDSGDLFAEPPVALPPTTLGEHVAEDYVTTGLSLKAHPCAFFRVGLARRGVITSREHRDERLKDRRVSVAGLVLVRQRPGTAKGVIFLTLEDETGIVNVVVWSKVFEANRRIVMTSQFLLVRGKIQREGIVIHVVAEDFVDLTSEIRRLRSDDTLPLPLAQEPAPLSLERLLKSRDFH